VEISQILDAVKARFKLPPNSLSGLTLSPSFRNKKSEKSTKDQQIMDRLENELLSDLENEEEEDAN
jgi:hypothetical protein